ncbi:MULTISPECIES: DUF1648 domain-containing protein [Bacillus cereus group]|uniref:DUF1648 domain-containing protein n=1 Tax=Bacillus cereus VD048 TaxID=1053226 RepID=J8HNC8_BACCE|nr:DUF1648 domain-containing protein [Bacillus cereus]EJR26666.1 hypothetical protein IIG_05223 [Bacillus cereus VD048]
MPTTKTVPKAPLTIIEKLFIVLSFFSLLIMGGLVLWGYNNTSGDVPMHFNGQGNADRYGDKSEMILFFGISIVVFVSLLLSSKLTKNHFFSSPSSFNKSMKLYKNDRLMRVILGFETVILSLYIQWRTIKGIISDGDGLNPFIVFGLVIIMFITIFVFLRNSHNIKKHI